MNSLVEQSALLGTKPVVINNLNISKPPAGEPTLLTLDEVRTTFHEFGHALHGLFSDVTYPRFSGTSVPRDFVEYPSQVNEMWILWPEVLANYARHHATGEPLPQERCGPAQRVDGSGARASPPPSTSAPRCWTWPGMCWTPATVPQDALEFEAKALAAAGVAHTLIPPRYRTGLLPAHLRRRRLRGRLLLLHLERGAGRRNRGLVHRERRADPHQRRPLPRRAPLPRQQPGSAGVVPHPARTRRRPSSPS